MKTLGIDIGSTTAKLVLRDGEQIIYEKYERHFSQVRQKTLEMLSQMNAIDPQEPLLVAISGSAGLGLAQNANLTFVQEVFATGEAVKRIAPNTSAVIELGGEDAKIIFFDGGTDERMNGTCAGGTGAFIDQMATLLNVTVDEMDELSLAHKRIYPIASRCGVFAKTDIQPLLNQGARKEDIAASIYQAVVNQTIAGLARGRKITGKVLFLGGPLYYCKGLQQRFKETLKLSDENAVFPKDGRFSVALGASFYAEKNSTPLPFAELCNRIQNALESSSTVHRLAPLFENEQEYNDFSARHALATVPSRDPATYIGNAWLGIDCGSTTTKLSLISEENEILYSFYASNLGNPVAVVKEQLEAIYAICGDKIQIKGSAVTGYGEELIKAAFGVDLGVVETIAHYTAAKHFRPDVDFILDIGGQDIKCFRIRNGAIDSIMLNEACSSGCGSFVETFARSMGYTIAEFAKRGLFASAPVDLGSRCTVFMNSSVKQSQKDGATVEDISAGLSVSVVKNAIYKVIRASSPDELGEHVVVQGGTFYNDAVLRAFERELGKHVIRPSIAGLMGAYGAALYSKKLNQTSMLSQEELKNFVHTSKAATCHGCTNQCRLTVNGFGDGKKKYISGNQCERGLGYDTSKLESVPNLHAFKRAYLKNLSAGSGTRGTVGIPMALGHYELYPLWHGIFTSLGFRVIASEQSTRRTYEAGQFSIPSDTACYPAKLMHGHVEELLAEQVDAIFYPCLSYNIDEKLADNHYNCPVVAYYSELLAGNVEGLKETKFLYPYLNINSEKELIKGLYTMFSESFSDIPQKEIREAVKKGKESLEAYMNAVRKEGEYAIQYARKHNKRIMILAGRPYHIDPEVGHGIDKLALSLGFVVVSEDSIAHLAQKPSVHVLNQWTYHARLYRAAQYAVEHADTELVQLVSFGCGLDAITTDEIRSILEEGNKYYTQIKIDEITNLGAVRIRLRSLLGALEQ